MMELVSFDGFNSFIYYFFTPILRLPPPLPQVDCLPTKTGNLIKLSQTAA